MKKLLILVVLLLLAGCSSIKTKEEYKNGITLSSMDDVPSVAELVELKEGVEATLTLDGNRILVVTTEDRPQEIEIPITFETMDIDGTQEVDLSKFYSNPDKLSTASYSINEDRTVMTITDSEKSFDVPVSVSYPSYTVADDITIDTYVGYDINDFVEADEGVKISSELIENILTITLSKGIWSETLKKEVTLEDSSPMTIHKLAKTHGYPIVYSGNSLLPYTLTFNDENTVTIWSPENRGNVNGTKMYDETSVAWNKEEQIPDPRALGKNYYSLSDDGTILYWDQGVTTNTSPYIFELYLQD